MDRLVVTLALFAALSCSGATYYVRTDGDNANAGTSDDAAGAWRNVWKAASTAAAGDTVYIRAGEFNEFVTNTVSGTAASPITFIGTRSGADWLTIIDPSIELTNWVSAPEEGSANVYKTTAPWRVAEINVDGQRVPWIWTNGPCNTIDSVYSGSGITSGSNLLSQASSKTVTDITTSQSFNMWDALKVLWNSDNTTVYIRFGDDSDPNTHTIRGAPNAGKDAEIKQPIIGITSKSNIVWQDVKLMGGYAGFWITETASRNTLRSNLIWGTTFPIYIGNKSHGNTVVGCELFGNWMPWTNMGAFHSGTTSTLGVMRSQAYVVDKYHMGYGSSRENGITIGSAGHTNLILQNYIHNGVGEGVIMLSWLGGGYPQSDGTVVASNTISYHSSAGIFCGTGMKDTYIYDNIVEDNDAQVRIHPVFAYNESNRVFYIYRNTFNLPAVGGVRPREHVTIYSDGKTITNLNCVTWIYHNSFSGGRLLIAPNSLAVAAGSFPGLRMLNNIASDYGDFDWGCAGAYYTGWCTNGAVGGVDYSLTMGHSAAPDWWGANNITLSTNQWTTAAGMSFALPADSQAIGTALDTTTGFTFMGTGYSALPQTAVVKSGSAWDMGALEYVYPVTNRTINVQTLNVR